MLIEGTIKGFNRIIVQRTDLLGLIDLLKDTVGVQSHGVNWVPLGT